MLHADLVKQYEISDMPGVLLSPWAIEVEINFLFALLADGAQDFARRHELIHQNIWSQMGLWLVTFHSIIPKSIIQPTTFPINLIWG